MTKFLKALRVKESVLKQNLLFMRSKRALQHWNQRVELTNMLRRKNEKAILTWKHRVMARVFNGLRSKIKYEKISLSRMNKIVGKLQHLDAAKAF